MKLHVFPNPLLFHWFSNNSFHLFIPCGDAKKAIKPPGMLQSKVIPPAQLPELMTIMENPGFSGTVAWQQGEPGLVLGDFALTLPG